MKLTKVFAALAFASVLGACSTASDIGNTVVDGVKATGTAISDGAKAAGSAVVDSAEAVKNTVTGKSSQTVAYLCDSNGKTNRPVSATYLFDGDNVKSSSVTLGKKVLAKNLPVDEKYTDGVQFTDGKNVWTLISAVTPKNVKSVEPVMFTVKGQETDRIIVRNCSIAKK
ncbi:MULTISPECIES: Holliday junction resolvase [Rodentibacter]|uniref:Holliday junction resolvase n=1 Tax=Rodentibacter TaxID=1960084 RepID=UPI001CFE9406|nr:Holliday junction resolvase [Rodentibacter sp. JRC1]GJI56461.1 hypothetical protein HEMROJRC1_15730 [Rodentibacter sp. JRC1]